MNKIDVIGLLGSILVGFSLIPQSYKSLRENDVKSLSKYYLLITFLAAVFMGIYSIYYLILPMIIANCLVLGNVILLIILVIKNELK
tara:strand:- start:803 stop:1063 length:261 start_codon:yes stop_codon:yes gene_type:complete